MLEFKAVIVLPEITRNYGNYPYGNYVGNALVGKVITLNTSKLRMHCSRLCQYTVVKMTGNGWFMCL